MTSLAPIPEFSLQDRYRRTAGPIYLSGLQALVRLPIDQRRRDIAEGRSTAAFVSGYEGSPLAGYDLELGRQQALLDEHDVVFRPGVNEELAADAVQGSQLATLQEDRLVEGITGYWYGKAPGLDRATDALRHANLGGTSPAGGAVAFVGDDAVAKSSTVPSSSEPAMAELGMPTLVPADPQDVLDLGLHAVALSRFSGLWTGMKIATNVADASGTAWVDPERIDVVLPGDGDGGSGAVHRPSATYLQPHLAALERSMLGERLERARAYASANQLNSIDGGGAGDRIGVVAAGVTYLEVRQALASLGLDPEIARERGVRLLKLGMVFPLEPGVVKEFAKGLDEIVVVEEKRAFIETAIKDLLYGRPDAPAISGRSDSSGGPLLRADGALDADVIAAALRARLGHHPGFEDVAAHAPVVDVPPVDPGIVRTPFFCSGCPHNRSTEVPDGARVGAGIGCSGMAMLLPPERTGEVLGLTQMGGEGAYWIGMEPFVGGSHMFQNLGDGTFHHSGSLAVRAAVSSGASITFKLLYNSAVAMTGGQEPVGAMAVPNLTRMLIAEGVRRIVVTTDEPQNYLGLELAPHTTVRHRDELDRVQLELASIKGVTVMIHDQECATELRRKRKRGHAPEPAQRAFINERVCEGCGDCGRVSNCLSVRPVETEYGRKTAIHQDSCNKDFSCLDGDCPSFITVVPGRNAAPRAAVAEPIDAADLPQPTFLEGDGCAIRLTGVGGTGVVTVAQIVATAAAIAGHHVRAVDQTGLAQKGGAVVSDVKFGSAPAELSPKLAAGECDLYLGCDLLVAASPANLAVADPSRTVAVVSTSEVPTGAMVIDPAASFPTSSATLDPIAARTRSQTSRFVDAMDATSALVGDNQFANMFLLGVAYQLGSLPLDADLIEKAIGLNGVAVDTNRQVFRRGRQLVAAPESFEAALAASRPREPSPVDLSLEELVGRRAEELVAYQGTRYADQYTAFVERVAALERERVEDSDAVGRAVADHLFKLMAYKDEYEVARLSIDPRLREEIAHQFGPEARYAYRFHPPMLRALGMKRKLSLGSWFRVPLTLLYRTRRLRGTRLDPFGRAEVRRTERALIPEYRDLVERSLAHLTPATVNRVVVIAALPDMVRGYEDIKVNSVAEYRRAAEKQYQELISADSSPAAFTPVVERR